MVVANQESRKRPVSRTLSLAALESLRGEYLQVPELADLAGLGDDALRRRLGRVRRVKVPSGYAHLVDDVIDALERDRAAIEARQQWHYEACAPRVAPSQKGG